MVATPPVFGSTNSALLFPIRAGQAYIIVQVSRINFGCELAITYRGLTEIFSPTPNYGMNSQGPDKLTPRGIDGVWAEPPNALPDTIPAVKEAGIAAPADLIAFGDLPVFFHSAVSPGGLPGQSYPVGRFDFPFFQMNSNQPARLQGSRYESQRHQGLFNVVFCDTHVEHLKVDELFGITDDVTQRWNRDHLPHTAAWK